MASRLRIVGVIVIIAGLVTLGSAGYAWLRVQDGTAALQGFSEAQNVQLSYNDEGQLIDRGSTEGADAIHALLTEEWRWPAAAGDLDPNDPLIDTGTEYMYQMATIAYHTLHGTQNVVLTERVEHDGDGDGSVPLGTPVYSPDTLPEGVWDVSVQGDGDAIFEPGVYQVPVNERYWSEFDRTHPLDGPAREQAWTGTVHGLFAQLGVGATTASSLEMGQGIALVTALMGAIFLVLGGGLVWVGMGRRPEEQPA